MRILLLYASIGSGHLSVARAIRSALLRMEPGAQVEIADVFGRSSLRTGWLGVVSGLVHLTFPDLYTWSWQTGSMNPVFQLSCRAPWLVARVLRQIRQFSPHAIACTHALPCTVAAHLSGVSRGIPLTAVATDFDVHPYWPARQLSAFVAAGESGRSTLLARGMDPGCVYPFGIPIHLDPGLSRLPRDEEGLSVLVMAGGGQTGPYLPIHSRITALLRWLSAHEAPGLRWQFVFGANAGLLARARRILGDQPAVELLGYVQDLPRRLASADLVLTKPGGATLAEACALGTPALLLTRGAGQEAANARVLISAGAARLADNVDDVLLHLHSFQRNPGELRAMADCAAALGRPDAAEKTARLILSQAAGERL